MRSRARRSRRRTIPEACCDNSEDAVLRTAWVLAPFGRNEILKAIATVFNRSQRINAVVVHWEEWSTIARGAEEAALLKQLRSLLDGKVAPIITRYWAEYAFLFELLPRLQYRACPLIADKTRRKSRIPTT